MSKIFAGVFFGVFIGALAYETLNRSNPELVQRIRNKVSKKLDDYLGSIETIEEGAQPE